MYMHTEKDSNILLITKSCQSDVYKFMLVICSVLSQTSRQRVCLVTTGPTIENVKQKVKAWAIIVLTLTEI